MGLNNIFDKMAESCGNKLKGNICPVCKNGKFKVISHNSFKENLVCRDCGFQTIRTLENKVKVESFTNLAYIKSHRPNEIREIATNDSFSFIISISDPYVIEDNAEDARIELTDEIWDMLAKDIYQIENNMLNILTKTFGVTRDEGHDNNDALIGTIFPIKDEAVESLNKLADYNEPISTSKGDLFNYIKGSDRDLYKNTSKYSNLIDVDLEIF